MRKPIRMLALAACAIAVIAAQAAPPEPKAIIARVNKTAEAVRNVSYKARVWGEGALKDMPRVEGVVKARGNDKNELVAVWAKGVAELEGKKFPFYFVKNGEKVIVIDRKAQTCTTGKMPEAADLIGGAMSFVLMRELIYPGPFDDELNADSARYEGTRTIGGVECHVIYVVYKDGAGEARWYFGVKDYLPHRVDRIFKTEEGTGTRVLELHDLDASAKFDDKTFSLELPPGYTVKEYKPPQENAREKSPALLPVGSVAPDWTLKTPDGKEVTLSKLRGKVVLLDFWATWCGPCKQAMPGVQKLHEKFKGKPVVVYGVSVWEPGKADPAGYMKKKGYTYGLLLKGDEVAKRYKIRGIPSFYIIGRDGKIVFADMGYSPGGEMAIAKAIEKALKAGE